nr:uncharacterized protein LOC127331254 [Lolium perenne]
MLLPRLPQVLAPSCSWRDARGGSHVRISGSIHAALRGAARWCGKVVNLQQHLCASSRGITDRQEMTKRSHLRYQKFVYFLWDSVGTYNLTSKFRGIYTCVGFRIVVVFT